jgi:hypothetical protein
LALPWVGEFLREKLTGGNDSASGRLIFAFDGRGYRCTVGNSDVLCIHGNDVDPWNITDYDALNILGQTFKPGQPYSWIPNAGTKLVIDIMNGIKSDYPFVDLLKPEGLGLIAILYALCPSLKAKLKHFPSLVHTARRDRRRGPVDWLTDEENNTETDLNLGHTSRQTHSQGLPEYQESRIAKQRTANDWQRQTEHEFRSGLQPRDLLSHDDPDSTLGLFSAFVNLVKGRDKVEVLREAIKSMGDCRSFDIKSPDRCFTGIDKWADEYIDFVVTGHTHQEKAMCRRQHECYYYNSGTWVRLMRLEPDVLNSERQFRRAYASMARGSLEALDNTPGLVIRRPAIVSIERQGKSTRASLKRPRLKGPQVQLHTVEQSEFEVSK